MACLASATTKPTWTAPRSSTAGKRTSATTRHARIGGASRGILRTASRVPNWNASSRKQNVAVAAAGKGSEPGNVSYLKVYLSTAPVVSTVFFFVLAAAVIEVNRFFPDALTAAFLSK